MKIYDISLPISPNLPVWPGDPKIELEQIASMDKGDDANVSRIAAGVHIGTHVDAPHHFLNDGRTVENLKLDILTGTAFVLHLDDDVDIITAKILDAAPIPPSTLRLLLRTRNSHQWTSDSRNFDPYFVAISADGAEWLVAHDIQLVGVDYLSVAPFDAPIPTHQILLKAGIIALEGCDLSQVPQGKYELYCLPLKLVGSDGAPARAILVGGVEN
ncbi:MAG: cyclase family protein [Anaerolineae bacterium]|jgi:arylformamidase|nr:cyclase family protein [Anaerolineae bacterium]MBT4308925.1 cyclase family protein [Anaerolineae bacterium]MBT4456761.1 cyclase family protein [Anaerolineae bacterium]MBT4842943.1 cyclase family protein [Anaerolineae bacterium]MBT6061291.1 cyclase family protein [Anaerolineae bacterium]